MKEKIYTIPINDAFDSDCECPVCSMFKVLEDNAVDYTMGPSYMEDDVRACTDRLGFCTKHLKMVYDKENRLGMSLVLKTNFDKTINDIERLQGAPIKKAGLFKKGETKNVLLEKLHEINNSCFVCDRISNTINRYVDTIFILYKSDAAFREKYKNCKGFCTEHYELLLTQAPSKLSDSTLDEFVNTTNALYIDNMKRVRDDLAWFINKFDYKYHDEPWKNAKDSLQRSLIKAGGILPDDKKNNN